MALSAHSCVVIASIVCGFVSACAWFYASIVKITREQAVASRTKEAQRKGEKPNLSGVTLDGWEMAETFSAQARWNAYGAVLAACAIGLQAVGQVIASV